MSRGRRSGFTLIEALMAVVFLTAGIASVLNGFAQMSRTQVRLHQKQIANQLALQKLDELVATGEVAQASLDGDFSEEGRPDWSWSMASTASGIENLSSVRVEVTGPGSTDPAAEIDTLWYQEPEVAEEEETPN